MQVAVITGPTLETAQRRVHLADRLKDGLELRLDLFKESVSLDHLRCLLNATKKKVILTLRRRSHGGGYCGPEAKRLETLLYLLEAGPHYIDLEYDTDPDFFREVQIQFPQCHIISSLHNFARTPRQLDPILQQMRCSEAYAYKISTTANSLADAYKMLRFIQKTSKSGVRFIGLCMGEYGRITRREGIRCGNYLNYTILHNRDQCAPGLYLA